MTEVELLERKCRNDERNLADIGGNFDGPIERQDLALRLVVDCARRLMETHDLWARAQTGSLALARRAEGNLRIALKLVVP